MYIQWMKELQPDQIVLPNRYAGHAGTIPAPLLLHYGGWKLEVKAQFSNDAPQDIVGLSTHYKSRFTIPHKVPYEVYLNGTNLHIGPVIAILAENKKKLTAKVLRKYRKYLLNYPQIKGLIYICSVQGINPKNKTIEGYYYNPQTEGNQSCWTKGVFPYPGAGFRRTWINKSSRYDDLLIHIQRKIFNPYFFNKWELKEVLLTDPVVGEHLPYTRLLDHVSMKDMLNRFGSVYLKPASGSMGRGIMKVQNAAKGYLIIYRNNTKSFIGKQDSLIAFLNRLKKKARYLIQQPVVCKYQRKIVDFRVIMQKDGSQQWTCSGIIARFGRSGKIYTNDVSAIRSGRDALQTVFQLNEHEARSKEEEIISISSQACMVMEKKYGVFGDVGLDVVVDPNLKVWLLEINSVHQHNFASYLREDPQIYGRVLSRPLEYAKSLAGFHQENL